MAAKPATASDSRDWYILVPMAVVAFALGCWGFADCAAQCKALGPLCSDQCKDLGAFDIVLKSLSLVKGGQTPPHPGWQLIIAQWVLPIVAVLGGAKLILNRIRRDVRVALAKRSRNHVIVCGLGDTGHAVALAQQAAGRKVVVIERDGDCSVVPSVELAGIPVLKGSATDVHVLKLAGLDRSAALLICCGSDTTNIEVALRARDACSKRGALNPLRILCEVREDWLLRTVASYTASLGSEHAEFVAVNFYENGARALLNGLSNKRKLLLPPGVKPQILIAGFGNMGFEVLTQAVRSYFAMPGTKIGVTIIDKDARGAHDTIRSALPALLELADISFHSHEFGARDDDTFVDGLIAASAPDMVFVTTQSDETNLKTSLFIRARLDLAEKFTIPVFARDQTQPQLGALISRIEEPSGDINRLVTFAEGGLLAGADALGHDPLDTLARAVHGLYAQKAGNTQVVSWDKLSERMKRSNRFFADHVAVKLARFGFDLVVSGTPATFSDAEVEVLAQMEHWRWTIEQRLDGWQHAPVRDDLIKRHPLLVPWADLPEAARNTNREMVRGIPDLLASVGKVMRRNRVVTPDTAPKDDAGGRVVALSDLSLQSGPPSVSVIWAKIAPGMTPAQVEAAQAALGPSFEAWVDARVEAP